MLLAGRYWGSPRKIGSPDHGLQSRQARTPAFTLVIARCGDRHRPDGVSAAAVGSVEGFGMAEVSLGGDRSKEAVEGAGFVAPGPWNLATAAPRSGGAAAVRVSVRLPMQQPVTVTGSALTSGRAGGTEVRLGSLAIGRMHLDQGRQLDDKRWLGLFSGVLGTRSRWLLPA